MKYKDTDICTCGCKFEDHDCHQDGWCIGCISFSGKNDCAKFKLDNLVYLERRYNEKAL